MNLIKAECGKSWSQKKQFLRDYVKALRDGNAAVFADEGLSRIFGYVEYGFAKVDQYVRNDAGNRENINQTIVKAFNKDVALNPNV